MENNNPGGSTNNELPKKESKTENTIKIGDDEYTEQELLTAKIFVSIITVGLLIVIIGGIWSIGDIFSQDKFGLFLSLSPFTQVFLTGIILILLFILGIFLAVFYRKGRNYIVEILFKEKPKITDKEEYLPAKIITFGMLISIVLIILGLLIALIQFMVDGATTDSGFWSFLGTLTGGLTVLLIGGFVLIFSLLALAVFYAWQNGYYQIMKLILERNEIETKDIIKLPENQEKISLAVYIICVADVVTMVIGIIYAVMDAISPTGKWEAFVSYPFGVQFCIIGFFASGIFLLLVFGMILYKRGNLFLKRVLFVKKKPVESNKKDEQSAKIIAIGILVGVILITASFTIWLISLWFNAFGTDVTNPFIALSSLSGGLIMLSIGVIIAVFIALILMIVFIVNNGYYIILQKIIEAQKALDQNLEIKPKKKAKTE